MDTEDDKITIRTAIRLTPKTKAELETLAKLNGRSLANYMRYVLTQHVLEAREKGDIQ